MMFFICSYQTLLAKFFPQRGENGIDTKVIQEQERIGPNYMKAVERFAYLLAKEGSNNNYYYYKEKKKK